MTKFIHPGLKGKLLRLANIITLDRYTHDEKLTPELLRVMDEERRLAYHTHFLRQVAQSGPVVEVGWKIEEIFPSLPQSWKTAETEMSVESPTNLLPSP